MHARTDVRLCLATERAMKANRCRCLPSLMGDITVAVIEPKENDKEWSDFMLNLPALTPRGATAVLYLPLW